MPFSGFCDSLMSATDVFNAIKGSVKVNLTYIDKVVIVCSGRIEKPHSDSIKQFMRWLHFEDFKGQFVFVYNKSDPLSLEEKTNNLLEMCNIFGADTNQCSAVQDYITKEVLSINMNLTTGFPPGAGYEEVGEDHTNLTNACLCVPGGNVKERRIPVDKSSCIIL